MKNLIKNAVVLSSLLGYLVVFPAIASAATLSLQPNTGTFNRGCILGVKIMLDTQGAQTDGTDAILNYDPGKLTVTTSNIVNGTIYQDYPGNSVDSAAGKVSISGISSVSVPFSGAGQFALVNFTVNPNAATGPINISFDFDPNNKTKTTDSNVVERGTIADLLAGVTDGSYTIGTGSCIAAPGGQGQVGNGVVSTPSATKTPIIDTIVGGKSGLLDNTVMLTVVGVALVIIGAAGIALL